MLDENYKNAVDSEKMRIFLTGVTDPDGNEYSDFNGELPYYIQLGEDWNRDDVKALFISSGSDEIIDISYLDSMDFPDRNDEFAKLTLKHFSPYSIYDELTDEERKALEKINNIQNNGNNVQNNDNYTDKIDQIYDNSQDVENSTNNNNWFNFVETGDSKIPSILMGSIALLLISGIASLKFRKKREE